MKSVELMVNDKKLILETGLLAKQADGAVVAKYGDTMLLATVVSDKHAREGKDFFPLTVDYQEKGYSAGRIPGGYKKREGVPSEKEILTSRLTDRPLRPLFPETYFNETQAIINVFSYGNENVSDVLGITAISAALTISDIPFDGPVAAVRVGMKEGVLVINPTLEACAELDLNLVVAGTYDAVTMVEGGAHEVSEDDMLKAIAHAHKEIQRLVQAQNEFREIAGRPKRPVPERKENKELTQKVKDRVLEKMKGAISIPGKLIRQKALDEILDDAKKDLNPDGSDAVSHEISGCFNDLEMNLVRGMILNEGKRADGRGPDEIRHIECRVGLLPRTHGSALFIRGETQALVTVTLGTTQDEQKIESLDGDRYRSFMLHYNFPPFSVGEVKPLRQPGRREIGHGALAERSIAAILPPAEMFPYTIRVVSEILESNGSSSMATVCGATLSLMDAGVPIKAPVAGIAMGLIKEGGRDVVLSDILGVEDHLGDMDFKVSGTEQGITAFQLDVKIKGISLEIMAKAVERARVGRLHILGKIKETLAEPRSTISPNAPRILQMQIRPERIKDVIGTGGKIIRGIVEQTGAKINVDDNGVVTIAAVDEAALNKAREIISGLVEEAEIGKIYTGRVKKIMDFGAFVEFMPHTEGLVHISQIAERRIENVTDEIHEGDDILVKVIGIDPKTGKIKLSRKEAMRDTEQ